MTTTFIGTTFPKNYDWHVDEIELIDNIQNQISKCFANSENLFINSTWFGPQFDNGQWQKYKKTIAEKRFDRIFILAAADPVFLNNAHLLEIQNETNAHLHLLGHFDTEYYFNFHSLVLPKYFVLYDEQQLLLQGVDYVYLNYNRKPRDHRNALVHKFQEKNLLAHGIVTLGKEDRVYSKETISPLHLSLQESTEDAVGNWGMNMNFGIPHDIHSLGRLSIWQKHFLTVVGETEFYPWDNMFISEKTWKPILGLRPFVINGQTKIYQYLRDQGFKTFEKYFNGIRLENISEHEVHESIIDVIKYLSTLTNDDLRSLYYDMLPDLIHNRNRFFEYAREQQLFVNNLFKN